MAKPKPKKDDFFEVIPGAVIDEFNSPEAQESPYEHDAKVTAIVTIILTIIVAVAMGVLFLKGVNTVKSNFQQQSGQIIP